MNPSTNVRIVACPGDTKDWNFYVINDGENPLDRVVLQQFEHEWGNDSEILQPNAEILDLAAGAHALLWEENDIEFRMSLELQLVVGEIADNIRINFESLYKRQNELVLVDGLGKNGCVGCVSHS